MRYRITRGIAFLRRDNDGEDGRIERERREGRGQTSGGEGRATGREKRREREEGGNPDEETEGERDG